MRSLKTILVIVLFVLVTTTFIFSDDSKVRVTASKANIRLKPTTQSEIVSKVPLGAMLDVLKKEGNWYFVKLPADERSIVVTGYIHQSIVEVLEEMKQVVESKKEVIEKKEIITPKEGALSITRPVESKKSLKDIDYLTWKAEYDKAEITFIKWKKYAKIGMFTLIGASVALPIIAVLVKENYLAPVLITAGLGVGGAGLWLFANGKRSAAGEKMMLLLNRGKIKGYISAIVVPQKKIYALSFNMGF